MEWVFSYSKGQSHRFGYRHNIFYGCDKYILIYNFIVVHPRDSNPTISVDIIDKSQQPLPTLYHKEFLQDIKGSELLLSLGYNAAEFGLMTERDKLLKHEETLYSQGVTTGQKLTSVPY